MRHWKLIVGAVVVVVLLAGAAAALALTNTLGEAAAGDVSSGPATGEAQHLVMRDNAFEPTSITVASGSPVQIELRNDGQANHNFTSEALHVSTGPMKTGDVKTVTVSIPKGTTQFICTWHQGMTVDLVGS
jgi:plastocyanin